MGIFLKSKVSAILTRYGAKFRDISPHMDNLVENLANLRVCVRACVKYMYKTHACITVCAYVKHSISFMQNLRFLLPLFLISKLSII